jgi:hypothetical protein
MMNKSIFILGVLGIMLQCSNVKEPQIDADFPGGNIKVLNIKGDSVNLLQELRDSSHDEIYWSFRVRGAEGRTLHFTLLPWSVSTRGPAVSNDGMNWHWLSDTTGFAADKFDYSFKRDEKEIYFSQCINYTEKNLNLFLEKHKNNPALKVESIGRSEKGRNVELLRICENKNAPFKIYLSSRNHCNETMGTYAMEGIIETVLSDTEDGKWLREHCNFFMVPLVDKDGVEEGDQGKNRLPHDHNRDYIQRKYHSVRAITEQVPKWADGKPLFLLDLHCPWLRGGDDPLSAKVLEYTNRETNEYFYLVGPNTGEKLTKSLQQYGEILEKERKGTIPFKVTNILPFGKSWNIAKNISRTDLQGCAQWGATQPNTVFAGGTEIPFANAEGVVVDANSARDLGKDLAHAMQIYLESYHE